MSVSATRLNKMLNSRRFFSSSTAAKLSRPLAPATNFQQSYNSNYKNHSNGSNSNTSSDSNFSNADMGSMAAAISATSLATAGLFYVLNGSSPAQSGPNLSDPKAKPMIKELTKNTAFVFIKPHANTVEARRAVKEGLLASGNNGMKVLEEGLISGERIEKDALIDNHYYSIASKATLLPPSKLNVPENKFKEKFGCEWKDMLSQNKVFNAKEACKVLGLTSEELNTEWAKSKKANKLVKFGGGFYCGLVDSIPGKQPIYVMNGFFMSMRQNYVAPGSSIYYYVVEWDSDKLSWEDFRGKLLGPTDPATAPEGSLRGMFLQRWRSLGLAYQPNVGDNAVHASASPFESLSERMNWLSLKPETDKFGQAVLKMLGGNSTLDKWKVDPTIVYGYCPIKKSVFDSLEDTDSSYCLALLGMMKSQLRGE